MSCRKRAALEQWKKVKEGNCRQGWGMLRGCGMSSELKRAGETTRGVC